MTILYNILGYITDGLGLIKKYPKFFLGVAIAIFVMLFFKQCEDNRQSSTDIIDPIMYEDDVFMNDKASDVIKKHFRVTHELYNDLLKAGIAREQARMVLPLATTTKIQMTGSIRSWIHFLELRDDSHAQKEIQLISKEIKKQLKTNLPVISEALNF